MMIKTESGEKHASGGFATAEAGGLPARVNSAGLMPGLKPWPTLKPSFSKVGLIFLPLWRG
jgi:hypothetical protein